MHNEGARGLVSLKVPADIEKLLDYTASGVRSSCWPAVGPVEGTRATCITANNDSDIRIIQAKTEADTLGIMANAQDKARQAFRTIEPGDGGKDSDSQIEIPVVRLTSAGQALFGIIDCPTSMVYLKALAGFLQEKRQCKLYVVENTDGIYAGKPRLSRSSLIAPQHGYTAELSG